MKTIYTILLSVVAVLCCAQSDDDKFKSNELQLSAGFNSQSAFEAEFAYSHLFNRYIGITSGLNIMDQTFDLFTDILLGRDDDYYDTYHPYRDRDETAVLLRAAARFRIPLLADSGYDLLALNIEPGTFISLLKNERGTFFPHVKSYLTLEFEKWQFSAGCGFSNFSMSESHRNKLNTVSVLATVSYRF